MLKTACINTVLEHFTVVLYTTHRMMLDGIGHCAQGQGKSDKEACCPQCHGSSSSCAGVACRMTRMRKRVASSANSLQDDQNAERE